MHAKCLWLTGFAAALLAAGPVQAADARLEIHVNGLFAWGDFEFTDARTLRLLGRDVPVRAAYDLDSALGVDLGLHVEVAGPLGLRASVSHATHEGVGRLTASLPPILPGLPDRLETLLPDGRLSETAAHVSAVLSVAAGPARISVLGGVTFFDLEASLIESVDVAAPGRGSLNVTGLPRLDVSDSATGWNAGLAVDVKLARRVGLGGFLRYSRATAELVPPRGDVIGLEAGGAHAGLGLRLMF